MRDSVIKGIRTVGVRIVLVGCFIFAGFVVRDV